MNASNMCFPVWLRATLAAMAGARDVMLFCSFLGSNVLGDHRTYALSLWTLTMCPSPFGHVPRWLHYPAARDERCPVLSWSVALFGPRSGARALGLRLGDPGSKQAPQGTWHPPPPSPRSAVPPPPGRHRRGRPPPPHMPCAAPAHAGAPPAGAPAPPAGADPQDRVDAALGYPLNYRALVTNVRVVTARVVAALLACQVDGCVRAAG